MLKGSIHAVVTKKKLWLIKTAETRTKEKFRFLVTKHFFLF
jgi:hypothetical protein